jgi:hypothetical protein
LIINPKKLQQAHETKKKIVDSAKMRPNLWQVSKVKINYLFPMGQE